jgi:SAM-dependent methyltransferase
LSERPARYGTEPSNPARSAAERFDAAGVVVLLELGAGQGRDTLFFAERGLRVHALDYTASGVKEIAASAVSAGLGDRVRVSQHDVRHPLPFADASFDACYSHMLYCMALSEADLARLNAEVRRVLRGGGLNVYTARTTADPDYGKGTHHGERMYEFDGFVVHFYGRDTVERLSEGFEVVAVEEFEEGTLPRRLFQVTLRMRCK